MAGEGDGAQDKGLLQHDQVGQGLPELQGIDLGQIADQVEGGAFVGQDVGFAEQGGHLLVDLHHPAKDIIEDGGGLQGVEHLLQDGVLALEIVHDLLDFGQ